MARSLKCLNESTKQTVFMFFLLCKKDALMIDDYNILYIILQQRVTQFLVILNTFGVHSSLKVKGIWISVGTKIEFLMKGRFF